jgi:hypothetical protein
MKTYNQAETIYTYKDEKGETIYPTSEIVSRLRYRQDLGYYLQPIYNGDIYKLVNVLKHGSMDTWGNEYISIEYTLTLLKD